MNPFKNIKHKYTIQFRKTMNFIGINHWQEVTDTCLVGTLQKLQEKHQFDVISINFSTAVSCEIVIKCKKASIQHIVMDYCTMLDNKISNIAWK